MSAATSPLASRAWDLGAEHARGGVHPWNMLDESGLLMDALGEPGPTTDENADERGRACDAYEGGYATGRHGRRDECAGCAS